MNVVVSQSMYFPWVGLLEQTRLADVFVHYDDVQFARGFFNRVQVKTASGVRWMTVPLREQHRGQRIDEVRIDNRDDWQSQHRDLLKRAHRLSPFRDEMLAIVDSVLSAPTDTLADIARKSTLALVRYFSLAGHREFVDSRSLNVMGQSSGRLHDIVSTLGGSTYITGHGARHYLDHQLFETSNINVQYMCYQCIPYQQLHGAFTPYVTALDLIANCGVAGARVIISESVSWRKFVALAA